MQSGNPAPLIAQSPDRLIAAHGVLGALGTASAFESGLT
jgi:hypothetical protein